MMAEGVRRGVTRARAGNLKIFRLKRVKYTLTGIGVLHCLLVNHLNEHQAFTWVSAFSATIHTLPLYTSV